MKRINYIMVSLLLVSVSLLVGCSDEGSTLLSKAVLASTSTLNFEATGTSEKIITVYADADWVTEVPEWVTVTPASGTGTMDVTISVTENTRGGAVDNPRKAAVVFKGSTLASQAEVVIFQDGDKYRDCQEYTLAELAALADEAVVSVPQVTVTAVTTKGFIVSEGTVNIFMQSSSAVSIGDKVSVKGSKLSDTYQLPYVECDEVNVNSTGGTVTYPTATDITNKVDTYTSASRTFITVNGIMNGNNVTVEGSNYAVSVTDAPESFGIASLNGHKVKVTGYFAGAAAPVVRLNTTTIEDLGIVKVIYFSEDFEWLAPWAVGNAGSTVETDDLSALAPQIPTPKVDGISALDALLEKGYQFLRVTPTSTNASECVYLQTNYLKFGKTGYQAGIILPKLDNVPSGVTTVLSFDWCPMRQGSGVIDPVNLIVIVANGSDEVTFDGLPGSASLFVAGEKLKWVKAEVQLTGVSITKDTKITIRQSNWQLTTANRWFLDNIEIAKAN